MSKKEALQKVKELIDDFQRNKDFHTSKEFLENHCEEQFVKPFLRALGWDLESRGIAPYLREVITQDRVTSRKTKRAPDYGFRLPGSDTRLFFLEAKGAFVKLKTDKDAAQQARWYGRAGKTPITILFNFAEFAVYDCTQKQTASSDAKFARIKYFTFDEYESNFDFIYDTFSREAIYNGNFQNFIKDKTQKKGNVTLDKDFVESLEKWRLKLAKNIAANNFKLNNEELNHAVQLLLDRIIFLRFCEERDVEPFGQLQSVSKSAHVYKNLFDLFYTADEKYNSGLFHFQDGCITEKLKVEDKTLREVIEDLYPPKSDYSFYLMPVEILGNAYEQFLGKVIRITAGHNIKIELKPEVRKAGGVYYTPQYIVDYIVENTVGKLIDGKTPKEIEKIKIVDPACGSGSFLLGAFKYLLNYHQNYFYKKSPDSKELNPDGTLTTIEKRKILTNNIFGVDLDENAVEVSKLSLLLKCMEGETASTVKQQITLHHTRVLPDLDKNIVNGNSLVGYDLRDDELELDKQAQAELLNKVHPFDWKTQFPNITKQNGFDVIIGNPPYVMLQNQEIKEIFNYTLKKYQSAKYKIDTYQLFIEKSVSLLKDGGLLSFITPNTFLKNIHSEPLRNFILNNTRIKEFVLYNYSVFPDASVDTCTFVFEKGKSLEKDTIVVKQSGEPNKIVEAPSINQSALLLSNRKEFNLFISGKDASVLSKINKNSEILGKYCDAYFGIQTFNRDTYVSDKKINKNYVPVIDGVNIEPYFLSKSSEYVNFIPEAIKSGGNESIYKQDRICIRQIGSSPVATYVPSNIYTLNTIYNVYLTDKSYNLKFLLGIINSNFTKFYWRKNHSDQKKTFPKIKKESILSIPIPKMSEPLQSKIIKHVDSLISLNKDLRQINKNNEIEKLKKEIKYHKNEINEIIYDFFKFSTTEIQIIESTANESN